MTAIYYRLACGTTGSTNQEVEVGRRHPCSGHFTQTTARCEVVATGESHEEVNARVAARLVLTPAQQKCLLAVGQTLGSVGRTRIVDVAGVLYPPKERTERAQMNGGAAASSYHRNTAKLLEKLADMKLVYVEFGTGTNRWYSLSALGQEVYDGLA